MHMQEAHLDLGQVRLLLAVADLSDLGVREHADDGAVLLQLLQLLLDALRAVGVLLRIARERLLLALVPATAPERANEFGIEPMRALLLMYPILTICSSEEAPGPLSSSKVMHLQCTYCSRTQETKCGPILYISGGRLQGCGEKASSILRTLCRGRRTLMRRGASAPALVEAPPDLHAEVLCPDGVEAAQACRGDHIADDANHNDGRRLDDGDRLIMDTGTERQHAGRQGHARAVPQREWLLPRHMQQGRAPACSTSIFPHHPSHVQVPDVKGV